MITQGNTIIYNNKRLFWRKIVPQSLRATLLSLEKVVQAWDDEAYDEAMQPVIDVLEKVKQAMPIFDALISKAKQELEVIK